MCCPITWVIWRVSYQRQKLLTLRGHLGSASVFGRIRVAHLFSFLLFSCLFFFLCSYCVLYTQCCPFRWIVRSWLPLWFSLTFIKYNIYGKIRVTSTQHTYIFIYIYIRVIAKLPNTEQSSKGKVKTHKSTNRQNQSTTWKLGLLECELNAAFICFVLEEEDFSLLLIHFQ